MPETPKPADNKPSHRGSMSTIDHRESEQAGVGHQGAGQIGGGMRDEFAMAMAKFQTLIENMVSQSDTQIKLVVPESALPLLKSAYRPAEDSPDALLFHGVDLRGEEVRSIVESTVYTWIKQVRYCALLVHTVYYNKQTHMYIWRTEYILCYI